MRGFQSCLWSISRQASMTILKSMADATIQTALAEGVPTLAVLVGILINNSRLNDLRSHMDARFDDMRKTWRAELHRVEEVLDARLKHLEAR
jgi:hypothetical protein